MFWTVFGALLIFAVAFLYSSKSILNTAVMMLSYAPLTGLFLALSSPSACLQFNNWLKEDKNSLYYLGGGLSALFVMPAILTANFDPYNAIAFTVIVFAVFGVLKQNRDKEFILNWSDIALWMLLWIPFDFRWYMGLQSGLGYTWWSFAISVIAIIGWFGYRSSVMTYSLLPKLNDLKITALALLMITVATVPPGLAAGFLSFSVPETYDVPKLMIHFIGLFFTVALPEELFFRGILLRGLDKLASKKWIPLVVSSIAFGLMHWNNVDDLSMQITYVFLATIAGLFYGWVYIKSGYSLFAAILTHTLVDWIWKLFLVP